MELARLFAGRGDVRDAADLAEASARIIDDKQGAWSFAARCAVRLGDGKRVLRLAKQLLKPVAWINAEAYRLLGEPQRAQALYGEALRELTGDEQQEAVVHFAAFLRAEGRLDAAEELVRAHLESARGNARTRLEEALGRIELERERLPNATRHFERAATAYAKSGERDELLHATILEALSGSILETIDVELLPAIDVDPPVDLGREAMGPWCFALQNRGWMLLLAGKPDEAFESLLKARAAAAGSSALAAAETSLASFSRIAGAGEIARKHLAFARKELLAPEAPAGGFADRITRVSWALEAHEFDPAGAAQILARSQPTGERQRTGGALEVDRRAAWEAMAHGVLEAIDQRRSSAAQAFGTALDIWSRLGYRYREAVTALLLHGITHDPSHLALAARALAAAPKSWLSEEAGHVKALTSSGVAKLTPAERRVMLAICEGKTSREIAHDFQRSFHTIRNQTLKVYAAMGVRSRAALVAECARLGLISPERR